MTKKFDNFNLLLRQIMDESSDHADESLEAEIVSDHNSSEVETKNVAVEEKFTTSTNQFDTHPHMQHQMENSAYNMNYNQDNTRPFEPNVNFEAGVTYTFDNGTIEEEEEEIVEIKQGPAYYTKEELETVDVKKRKDNGKIIDPTKKKRKIRPCKNYD